MTAKWTDCTGDPCICPRPGRHAPDTVLPSVNELTAPPVALIPEGWRCPDCRHVYAPSVKECARCPRTLGQRIADGGTR